METILRLKAELWEQTEKCNEFMDKNQIELEIMKKQLENPKDFQFLYRSLMFKSCS